MLTTPYLLRKETHCLLERPVFGNKTTTHHQAVENADPATDVRPAKNILIKGSHRKSVRRKRAFENCVWLMRGWRRYCPLDAVPPSRSLWLAAPASGKSGAGPRDVCTPEALGRSRRAPAVAVAMWC